MEKTPDTFLYHLPADAPTVRVIGYNQALENAYQVILQDVTFGETQVRGMADSAANLLEQQVYDADGRHGANDVLLFRQTFVEAFLRAYPIVRARLLTGELVLPANPAERVPITTQYAEDHVDELGF